jgi:hypothetical protein
MTNDREKLAQWMINKGYSTGHGDTTEDLLKELEWQIAEQDKYTELLLAVGRKFPGETRHQTALRYINEAERLTDVWPKREKE